MADKLISQLGANAAVLTTHKFPIEPVGGPPAEYNTIAQLVTLLDTLYLPLIGGTLTGKLIITQATANTSILTSTGYSLTGANAQNMLDFAGTWNTSGNPTALKIAITNTASGATAKLFELLAGAGGATSMFSIDKTGVVISASSITSAGGNFVTPNAYILTGVWTVNTANMRSGSGIYWGWSSAADNSAASDTTLLRGGAAGTLILGNAGASTDFNRLMFGGTTSAFPAIKRSAATLQVRLADDSAFGSLSVLNVLSNNAASLITSSVALTDFAAAGVGTLTNAPTAGNPAKWIAIVDNGTTRYIPTWI